jgi:phosphohistidine phosphatase
MLRLMLLRHAKSSWDTGGQDHDRPLNIRGKAAAPLMGRHMADHALIPDRVICSTARRTRDTFAALLPFFSNDLEVRFLRAVYEAEDGYLPLVIGYGGDARSLLVVGHNPAIQSTALEIIGSGNPALTSALGEKFPTAGLAVIDIDSPAWKDVRPHSGRIVAFFRPRELEVVGDEANAASDE